MPAPAARRQDVRVPETTLYLFDGYNLLNAGAFRERRELVDLLASYVAGEGVRGVVVFDGVGEEREVGPLSVRFASHADDLLERLAAQHRLTERVCIVSSDDAVRRVSGQEVRKLTSKGFLWTSCPPSTRSRNSVAPEAGSASASTRRRARDSSGSGAAGRPGTSKGRDRSRPFRCRWSGTATRRPAVGQALPLARARGGEATRASGGDTSSSRRAASSSRAGGHRGRSLHR